MFEDLDAQFLDPKAFAREEQKDYYKLVALDTVPAPEDWMTRRNIAYESAAFKAAYPNGLPCLMLGLQGISVKFEGLENNTRYVYIPMQGTDPDKYGERKGRRTQLNIVTEAFVAVYGIRPFGSENRQKLIGRVDLWGQHLGEMQADGETREWGWDVPRQKLPDGFKYEGDIRIVQARQAETAGGVGTPALSEQDIRTAVQGALVGLSGVEAEVASERILAIKGLPDDWYNAAMSGSVLAFAVKQGVVMAEDGVAVPA